MKNIFSFPSRHRVISHTTKAFACLYLSSTALIIEIIAFLTPRANMFLDQHDWLTVVPFLSLLVAAYFFLTPLRYLRRCGRPGKYGQVVRFLLCLSAYALSPLLTILFGLPGAIIACLGFFVPALLEYKYQHTNFSAPLLPEVFACPNISTTSHPEPSVIPSLPL